MDNLLKVVLCSSVNMCLPFFSFSLDYDTPFFNEDDRGNNRERAKGNLDAGVIVIIVDVDDPS